MHVGEAVRWRIWIFALYLPLILPQLLPQLKIFLQRRVVLWTVVPDDILDLHLDVALLALDGSDVGDYVPMFLLLLLFQVHLLANGLLDSLLDVPFFESVLGERLYIVIAFNHVVDPL